MALDKMLEEILSKRKNNGSPVYCAYQNLYNNLDKEDQKTLDKALADKYPINLIVQALRADGKKISSDAIRLHRNEQCRCPKN